jgi:hypothetical protein
VYMVCLQLPQPAPIKYHLCPDLIHFYQYVICSLAFSPRRRLNRNGGSSFLLWYVCSLLHCDATDRTGGTELF